MARLSKLLVLLVMLCSCSSGGEADSPLLFDSPIVNPTTVAVVSLPVIRAGMEEPMLPVVLDFEGNISTWEWLRVTFGQVEAEQGALSKLTVIRAIEGPAVIVVDVVSQGQPAADVPVIRYWPDAPLLPDEYKGCGLSRGVIGFTNETGAVGFGLGKGDYYWPPEGGATTIWIVSGASACVRGLGMVALTNHWHLDPTFTIADIATAQTFDHLYLQGTIVKEEIIGGRKIPVIYYQREGD